MSRTMIGGLAVALAIGWTVTAGAAKHGRLEREQVGANAKWVVHVDVAAAKNSAVMKAFWEDCIREVRGLREGLAMVREGLGVDIPGDLHAITLYGNDIGDDARTAVVRLHVDADALRKRLADKAKQTEHRGHTIHHRTWRQDTPHAYTTAMAVKDDKLVIAPSVDLVRRALDVIDGQADRLAGDSPLVAEIPEGTICLARAIELGGMEIAGHIRILKQLDRYDDTSGEKEGRWCRRVRIKARSGEVAARLQDAIRGRVALAKVHFHEDKDILALLDKVQLAVDGDTVRVTFEAPAGDVAGKVPKFCEHFKQQMHVHRKICHFLLSAERPLREKDK